MMGPKAIGCLSEARETACLQNMEGGRVLAAWAWVARHTRGEPSLVQAGSHAGKNIHFFSSLS